MKLIIPGRLPGLNEYTNACRSHWSKGAKLKAEVEDGICWHIVQQKLTPVQGKASIRITWYEPNLRRDEDNVKMAKKYVLDALVKQGIIKGDGRKHITLELDSVELDRTNPRVEVEIREVG